MFPNIDNLKLNCQATREKMFNWICPTGGRPTNSFSSETSSDHDLKQMKEFNEEKRRSARRKEFILAGTYSQTPM